MSGLSDWARSSAARMRLVALVALLTLPFWVAVIAFLILRDEDFSGAVRSFTQGALGALRTGEPQ